MNESGKQLSMSSDAIYKGTFTNNGMLQKIHENSYTIGYSELLTFPDPTSIQIAPVPGTTKFGNAVFMNALDQNNRAYTNMLTGTYSSFAGYFGGIMCREPGIASGYPAVNDEVSYYQKGLLVKQGYINYKKGAVYISADKPREKDLELYGNVYATWYMVAEAATGEVYFTATATAKGDADMVCGQVVSVNPDDRSITVYVAPTYLTMYPGTTPATIQWENAVVTSTGISMTFTSAANVAVNATLTQTDGTDIPSQTGVFRGSLIELTGSALTAYRGTVSFDWGTPQLGKSVKIDTVALLPAGASEYSVTKTTPSA